MKKLFRGLSALVVSLLITSNTFAITWVPEEFTCPLDSEKNTFLVVASYGSYIYMYPSKYQWLFFPQTASPTYYTCKKCHLTTYMWDFDKLPKDKFDALRNALKGVTVSKKFKTYTELPVSERLEIMEKVYSVLGKDGDWWESFNRVKGYHYGQEGKADQAKAAREKSLESIKKDLGDPKSEKPRKLLLYMSASMKHFLGDDLGALADLEAAAKTAYAEKNGKAEELKKAETSLNERIADYIAMIKSSDKKPRLFDRKDRDADSHDDH